MPAYFSSDDATFESGVNTIGEQAAVHRTANAAASRSRSSMTTQAAARCGSR